MISNINIVKKAKKYKTKNFIKNKRKIIYDIRCKYIKKEKLVKILRILQTIDAIKIYSGISL